MAHPDDPSGGDAFWNDLEDQHQAAESVKVEVVASAVTDMRSKIGALVSDQGRLCLSDNIALELLIQSAFKKLIQVDDGVAAVRLVSGLWE